MKFCYTVHNHWHDFRIRVAEQLNPTKFSCYVILKCVGACNFQFILTVLNISAVLLLRGEGIKLTNNFSLSVFHKSKVWLWSNVNSQKFNPSVFLFLSLISSFCCSIVCARILAGRPSNNVFYRLQQNDWRLTSSLFTDSSLTDARDARHVLIVQ